MLHLGVGKTWCDQNSICLCCGKLAKFNNFKFTGCELVSILDTVINKVDMYESIQKWSLDARLSFIITPTYVGRDTKDQIIRIF